ncbi:hypothetical protein [Kribbella sp. CA-247076]|uniref:hypothetical protein n=1 Tax=Kribbella sp. CA-247076 TaxID=3239941 RepID=UPI003D8CD403
MAVLWSAISTTRHKLAAAADLTALSAAQSLQPAPTTPAATASHPTASAPTDSDSSASALADSPSVAAGPTASGAAASGPAAARIATPDPAALPPSPIRSATPCETAARIAALHQATLTACEVTADSVTVQLSTQLNLADITHPTLTATARAGPV